MANEEHLAMLRQGTDAWNHWRKHRPGIGPDLRGADLREAHLSGANLNAADLRGANLVEVDLSGADLGGADLGRADFFRADLSEVNLYKAKLNRTDLSGAHLSGAHLGGADLGGANLRWTNLSEANLTGADLSRANLSEANLSGADFSEARVRSTVFADVDLSEAKGIDMVVHEGPSSIGMDTIYRSHGKIPEAFLRGAGLPDEFITSIHDLFVQPIQFYSCFISYSSKDQEFAERLHADLQDKKVRVWFAPEDLKIGDPFRQRIEESIRVYDKLLVVLSENSVNSTWVASEVEAAFEKERKNPGRTVLFPIRLDDGVMDTSEAWAADIRRTRHIGDFTRWKDHDAYKKAFDRLLRDLKAESAQADT
jgi:hypothetical protein